MFIFITCLVSYARAHYYYELPVEMRPSYAFGIHFLMQNPVCALCRHAAAAAAVVVVVVAAQLER